MFQYLQGGFSPTDYAGFKTIRSDSNGMIVAYEDINSIVLTTYDAYNFRIITILDKNATDTTSVANLADYRANIQPFINAPIESYDAIFKTHDFSDKRTWIGDTTGDPASWVSGAVVFGVVNASNWPSSGQAYSTYGWSDASGNVVAWIDYTASPNVWRDKNNAIIVQYYPDVNLGPQEGVWKRTDTLADVTSSKYRVKPASGYKLQINQIVIISDVTAVIPSGTALHYKAYSYYPPASSVILVKDWSYSSILDIMIGSNMTPFVSPAGALSGHTGAMQFIGFDYSQSKSQVLDSAALQYLDISVDNNVRITNTLGARASFVARKIRSF